MVMEKGDLATVIKNLPLPFYLELLKINIDVLIIFISLYKYRSQNIKILVDQYVF